MNAKPVGKRVLIKRLQMDSVTEGGIVLPEQTTQKKLNYGEVLDTGILTGKEKTEYEFPVGVGSVVVFNEYSVTEFEVGDEKFIVLNVIDIQAVLNVA